MVFDDTVFICVLRCIKPRLYSIASSPRFDQKSLDLAVVILEWTTPSGKEQVGLSTDFIDRLKAGDMVTCGMTNGNIFLHIQNIQTF